MATIKLKYRKSSVKGNCGTLFFQIIHKRQVRQIYTELHISDDEWDAKTATIVISSGIVTERAGYLSSVTTSIKECQSKLVSIIRQFDQNGLPYSAQEVVMAYRTRYAIIGLVSFTRKLIDDMKRIGKKAPVKRFGTTLNSLLRYTNGNEVVWNDLNSTFILGFESFLMKRGLCRNSTSFYMRNLRAIVNRAIEQDFEVPRNPFKHVYMGVDKTLKRAVSIGIIRKIRDIDLTGYPSLDFARRVFIFAFYTRGMSFVDIAFLKKRDLHNGEITYCRRKTRQQIKVKIEPETRMLIDSFGNSETDYLLPIITKKGCDAERQYESAYYRINRNLKKVGKMLGLETKLTLYVARHAWASIALANKVAMATISKAMGHDSEKTTTIYLQSLDTSSVDNANSDIIRMIDGRKRKR